MTVPAVLACSKVTLQVGRGGARRLLVDDLDWTIAAGERWAVLGPNGAGKSTLLAVLAGVRRVDAGTLAYAGRPLSSVAVQAQAAHRALVADRWFDPFSASVSQTVLTGRYRFGVDDAGAREIARHALARVDCTHLAAADVRTLSRGERQRVAIATALVQDTPLLLLDEPLAHQDPRHQAVVLDVLRDTGGRTVVATLHDVNAASRFATHALLLTGRGSWRAGPVAAMLTAAAMTELFATPFLEVTGPAGQPGLLVQRGSHPPPL